MKAKLLLLFVSSVVSIFNVLSQETASEHFQEGERLFEEKNYQEAISKFRYVIDNYPKDELYPMAVYNIGYIYYVQENNDSALKIFEAILKSNYNEVDQIATDLMGNPNANYKHKASGHISSIYEKQGEYKEALRYLSLSETEYPFIHFCGNAYDANDLWIAIRYADIYSAMGDTNKAIEYLLPIVFGAPNYTGAVSRLKKLLEGQANLEGELNKALKKMYSRQSEQDRKRRVYYFEFLGAEIEVPTSYGKVKGKFDRRRAIEKIKKTEFYKLVISIS